MPPPDLPISAPRLPPTLPMPLFVSSDCWHAERVGALAIYCSDGRWGEAFDEFCHRCLLIPRYDRFAVPGGPAWISQIEPELPELYRTAHGQLEFLVHSHELERIVLITHYGCAFYGDRLHLEPEECLPAQFSDLKRAAQALRHWFPHLGVEGYLAMRAENTLSFHRLNA